MPTISIAAETIGTLFGLPITNSLLATWFVMAILMILAIRVSRDIRIQPSRLQVAAEMLIGGFFSFFENILGKLTPRAFPLIMSIFLFVIVANWAGLLPGFGSVGIYKAHHTASVTESGNGAEAPISEAGHETESDVINDAAHGTADAEKTTESAHEEIVNTVEEKGAVHEEAGAEAGKEEKLEFIPLLRGPTADINMTLAIAIIAVFAIQYFGFSTMGFHYSTRFIDFSNPINFFIGILEIISETSKIISFAFRLFGNIFAGEVLLTVMAFLVPFIAPLPFISLELFVGFIQALVFSMLTAVFLNVAVSHGSAEAHHE